MVIETVAKEPKRSGLDGVAAFKGSEVLDAVATRGVEHDDETVREETRSRSLVCHSKGYYYMVTELSYDIFGGT